MKYTLLTSAPVLFTFFTSPVTGITINLDYSDTNTSSGFFSNATARAALEAAANDISNAITTSLNAVTQSSFTGVNGITSIPITTEYNYRNPDTGASSIYTGNLAANEVRIFVGERSLTGSTLGQGGFSTAGFSFGAITGTASQVPGAIANLEALANAEMERGSFTMSTSSGTVSGNPVNINFAPAVGNLWFDNDSSTTWHLDHTTSVASGTSDLYSVALHEILHVIGIGTYDAWDALVSGTGDPKNWTGANAIAENGSGLNIIDGNGDSHIENGVMSSRISDGVMQEVVMDPNITVGTRKELTDLDLAFLEDLGWETTWVIPEPSTTLLSVLALGGITFRRNRRA